MAEKFGSLAVGKDEQRLPVVKSMLRDLPKELVNAAIADPLPGLSAEHYHGVATHPDDQEVPPVRYASWQDAIDNKPLPFAGMLGEDDGKDPTLGAFTQYPDFRQSVDVEDRRNETPASRESTKFPVVPDTEDLSTTALASDLGINDIERAALNEKFKRAVSQAQGSKAKK